MLFVSSVSSRDVMGYCIAVYSILIKQHKAGLTQRKALITRRHSAL